MTLHNGSASRPTLSANINIVRTSFPVWTPNRHNSALTATNAGMFAPTRLFVILVAQSRHTSGHPRIPNSNRNDRAVIKCMFAWPCAGFASIRRPGVQLVYGRLSCRHLSGSGFNMDFLANDVAQTLSLPRVAAFGIMTMILRKEQYQRSPITAMAALLENFLI